MDSGFRDGEIRQDVFKAMQEGKPYARYIKTIIGSLAVNILDPVRILPTTVVLVGDPAKCDPESIVVDVWTPAEDRYLKAHNRDHFESGRLVPYDPSNTADKVMVNQITDAEIEALILDSVGRLKRKLSEFTSDVPIRRILAKAEAMNRPVRTINLIKQELARFE